MVRGRPFVVLGSQVRVQTPGPVDSLTDAPIMDSRRCATGGGTGITTASSERLKATFRSSLGPFVRRGWALADQEWNLTAGISLVGCAYKCCWVHESLQLVAPDGAMHRWKEWTPATATGLTDHRWTMADLLHSQVPVSPWVAPRRRGRPPKRRDPPALADAA